MKELDRREDLLEQLTNASPRTRLAFAAAIAERLLPGAERPLTDWRRDAWPTLRGALDLVWAHLDGLELPMQRCVDLKETCYNQIPHDEDEDFGGEFGAQEAAIAVVYSLGLLINADPAHAVSAAIQSSSAIRNFLIFRKFPKPYSHRDTDEDAVFGSPNMQDEIQLQAGQLELLKKNEKNEHDFVDALARVKEESVQNPIKLTDS